MIEFLKKLNSHVPNFISRNFGRKMVAVFFAILVFAKVSNELSEEKIVQDVSITILKKGNVEVLAYKPETLEVTVKGSRNRLKLLSNSNIRIEIPVDEIELNSLESESGTARTVNYTITPGDVKTPNGVSVAEIFPSEISIRLDHLKSKEVPVEVSFQGGLPDDYSIGEIRVVPKVVSISGPGSIIEQIDFLTTKPIILDKGTVDGFSVERTFQIGDKKILISPKSVQVSVDVYKAMDTKLFQNVTVNMLIDHTPVKYYKVHLLTDKVNVTLGGLNSRLSDLKLEQIKAFVDLSKLSKPGIYDLSIDCWIMDPGVSLKFIDPPIIKAEIMDAK
ncbi:MAG: CdaR family protein [Lentisphaerota bacterium]